MIPEPGKPRRVVGLAHRGKEAPKGDNKQAGDRERGGEEARTHR